MRKIRFRNKNGSFKEDPVWLYIFKNRPFYAFKSFIFVFAIFGLIHLFLYLSPNREEVNPAVDVSDDTVSVDLVEPGISEFEIKADETDCTKDINKFLKSYPETPWEGRAETIQTELNKIIDKVNPEASQKEKCKSAKWLVAIGCTESGCGKNLSGSYNAWGLKDFRTGDWEEFESWKDAFYTYSYRTYRPYLQHNEMSAYKGVYCQSNCQHWESNVYKFLDQMNYN